MTENNVKQTPKQLLWTCAAIVLGNFLLAFAVAAFIIPSGVIMGGATGVGIIITHFIPLDTAAVIFVLNMLALALGYFVLGKGFAVKTVASSILYPMFLKVVQSIPGIDSLTDDWLLSVLLSGALVGVALFLSHLARRGGTMTELRRTYPAYFASKNKIALTPAIDTDKVLREIAARYAGERVDTTDGVKIGTVYRALDGTGSSLGYVIETTSGEGYGGNITLYAGITNDGIVNGVSILSIAETPGLGMRAGEVLIPQFAGKMATGFTYTKSGSQSDSEIDAISGATITTEAVTNAVNGAVSAFTRDLQKGGE